MNYSGEILELFRGLKSWREGEKTNSTQVFKVQKSRLRTIGQPLYAGADTFWLSPIYKSPMADFGYDISGIKIENRTKVI